MNNSKVNNYVLVNESGFLKNIKLLVTLSFLLTVFTTSSFGQITSEENGATKKYHYIIHNIESLDSKKIYNACLSKLNLDKYRLINERRFIEFNTGVKIELLSGEELHSKYKKAISPLNLTKENSVTFLINLDTGIITISEKN